jgi:hypothetical protein
MAGSGNRNERDAPDLNPSQTGAVHVQETADANIGIAVADDSLNTTERLHQEPKGHGREFRVKIMEYRYQLLAWVDAVDD